MFRIVPNGNDRGYEFRLSQAALGRQGQIGHLRIRIMILQAHLLDHLHVLREQGLNDDLGLFIGQEQGRILLFHRSVVVQQPFELARFVGPDVVKDQYDAVDPEEVTIVARELP